MSDNITKPTSNCSPLFTSDNPAITSEYKDNYSDSDNDKYDHSSKPKTNPFQYYLLYIIEDDNHDKYVGVRKWDKSLSRRKLKSSFSTTS